MEVFLVITIIVIIALIWNVSSGPWDHMDRLSNETLAQKLGDAGWTLYTRNGCPWCTKQLAEFNGNTSGLPVVECTSNPGKCADIQGVPAWVNSKTGKKVSGYKNKADMAGLLL